jgi:hypothetical protein
MAFSESGTIVFIVVSSVILLIGFGWKFYRYYKNQMQLLAPPPPEGQAMTETDTYLGHTRISVPSPQGNSHSPTTTSPDQNMTLYTKTDDSPPPYSE